MVKRKHSLRNHFPFPAVILWSWSTERDCLYSRIHRDKGSWKALSLEVSKFRTHNLQHINIAITTSTARALEKVHVSSSKVSIQDAASLHPVPCAAALCLSCIFSLTSHTQAADDDLPGSSHTLMFKGRGGELALM